MTVDSTGITTFSAHIEGHTVVTYTKDGSIVTSGLDALIRVYGATSALRASQEPITIDQHTEPVNCLAANAEGFASAGDDGAVCVFRNGTNEFQRYIVRSTVPVRALSYYPNFTKIAIAGDEEAIRIVLVQDITRIVSLTGHLGFVKSIDFDAMGDQLVSSGCEGDVRVWNTSPGGSLECLCTLKGVMKKTTPDSRLLGTVAWNTDGSLFAFPGVNRNVCVYRKGSWDMAYSLNNGHTDDVTTLSWSPNGLYICSAGLDNMVIIWNTERGTVIRKHTTTAPVSSIAWHHTENELSFTDVHGQLTVWANAVPIVGTQQPHPCQRMQKEQSAIDSLFEESTFQPGFSLPSGTLDAPDLTEEEGEDDVEMLSEMDDFVIDDDGAGYAEQKKGNQQNQAQMGLHGPRGCQHQITKQPRFQPGATSFRNMDPQNPKIPREGERRYLAFTMFGVVYTIYQGTHSIVNFEFHDQSQNRNFHFTDYNHFSMAAVGEEGAVLATDGSTQNPEYEDMEDEDSTDGREPTSILHYRPLTNYAENIEWTVKLPPGECIQSVAINRHSVIAVTSAGYVRIFTLGGVQSFLFRLENIVTTAGHANWAAFVYSVGTSLNGDQNLEVMLMDTQTMEITQKDKVPLNKNTELTWLGFSETSQLAMYDSKQVLSILHRQRKLGKATWVPIFDGKAEAARVERTERYWPIGLIRDRLMCLILRGSITAPFFPRPPVADVPLTMPTVHLDSEIGQMEEKYLRERIVSTHEREEYATGTLYEEEPYDFDKSDVEMDKVLLRLLQDACRANKSQRALDLGAAMSSARSMDAAIKLVSFHKLTATAERLTEIKEQKFLNNRARRHYDLLDPDDDDDSFEKRRRL